MDLGRTSARRSRRTFLIGGLTLTASGLLAACAGGAQPSPTAKPAAPTTAPAKPAAASPAVASPAAAASPSPAASPVAQGTGAAPAAASLQNPPPVPNAAAARQYSGQRITYYGDSVGLNAELDQVMAQQFTQDTGIQVNVVPRAPSATESYSTYQRFFQARSPDVDVLSVDVIWPGAFAPHLLDLSQKLGAEAQQHYESLIANNTVNGKLVAMPWFADFGMLYYRTDLMQKYGFRGPPPTWEELQQQAQQIVAGERGANANFAGFVFQGNAYEGLTCNTLEWLASTGGGHIVDQGQVSFNNPQAAATLNAIRGWVGNIVPRGATSYQEEDARNVFQGGNAAFMRNWPYAYALGQRDDSPIRGRFDVAPLPASPGQRHVGTVGGWQLAVSSYSRSPDASIEFVRYMTSPQAQTFRAVVPGASLVPTIPAVASRPEVLRSEPFLATMADVERVARPSNLAGERYNELSTIVFQTVNQILNGTDAAQALPPAAQRMERLLR